MCHCHPDSVCHPLPPEIGPFHGYFWGLSTAREFARTRLKPICQTHVETSLVFTPQDALRAMPRSHISWFLHKYISKLGEIQTLAKRPALMMIRLRKIKSSLLPVKIKSTFFNRLNKPFEYQRHLSLYTLDIESWIMSSLGSGSNLYEIHII